MNPLEWLPSLYGKYFANHPLWVGYLVMCGLAAIAMALAWSLSIAKYNEQHPKPELTQLQINELEKQKVEDLAIDLRNKAREVCSNATPARCTLNDQELNKLLSAEDQKYFFKIMTKLEEQGFAVRQPSSKNDLYRWLIR